jgi:hypothetical protein
MLVLYTRQRSGGVSLFLLIRGVLLGWRRGKDGDVREGDDVQKI